MPPLLTRLKWGYKVVLIVLVPLILAVLLNPWLSWIPEGGGTTSTIQLISSLAAFAGVAVALGLADLKNIRLLIDADVSVADSDQGEEYKWDELGDDLRDFYSMPPQCSIRAYRVRFRFVNGSGFSIRNPMLQFRIPKRFQHPDKTRQRQVNGTTIETKDLHTNLLNTRQEVKILDEEDALVLSNVVLPFWAMQSTIVIWIRMVLKPELTTDNTVDVYISGDGTEVFHTSFHITTRDLLESAQS